MRSSSTDRPRYPELRVSIRSSNPLALVAAVREELRRARVEPAEIARFSDEALAMPGNGEYVLSVAEEWIGTVEAA